MVDVAVVDMVGFIPHRDAPEVAGRGFESIWWLAENVALVGAGDLACCPEETWF